MKQKNSIYALALLILIMFIAVIFSNTVVAENRAELSFSEKPSYKLVSSYKNRAWTYEVTIKIENSGNQKSEYMLVNLSDEDVGFKDNSYLNYTYFYPGETKEIKFNYITTSSKDQKVTVTYMPEDPEAPTTKFNKDSTSFLLVVGDQDSLAATSTPGFEILFMLFALAFVFIIMKKKH